MSRVLLSNRLYQHNHVQVASSCNEKLDMWNRFLEGAGVTTARLLMTSRW